MLKELRSHYRKEQRKWMAMSVVVIDLVGEGPK